MRRTMMWFGAVVTALLLALGATPANADVNDFSYESWDATYELSLDESGRAVAKVTETLVPVFPDFDQNRGIIRGLPLRYEGAPAAPENISVTDETGASVPFTLEDDETFRSILVGDDSFVHGRQTYVISYTLHDVVLAATDTNADEFYWDILPLERWQNVQQFSATVDLSTDLASQLTGQAACYVGQANSTEQCNITTPVPGEGAVVVPPMRVTGGLGVTIAIGFTPGTVVQPPERLPSFALDVAPAIVGGTGALVAGAGALVVAQMRRKRRTHRGVIVAQYDVPASLPPLLAAPIVGSTGSPAAAEFVHLAVSGVTRIEEVPGEVGMFGAGKPRQFFRLLDPHRALDPLDLTMTLQLFPDLTPGTVFELPKKSSSFSSKMQRLVASGVAEAKTRGYFTKESSKLGRILGIVGLGLLVPAGVMLALASGRDSGLGLFFTIVFMGITAILALTAVVPHRVYTPAGAETREYLEGVREFIRIAEADRFKMLQSYSGADRNTDGTVNVVHLYEKLLPYAMLFGQEKEWGKALESQYEQQGIGSPYWYPGLAMSSGNLGGSLATFASTLSSAASYTSSSSGGSSGGGFSGGGGGGGFSGGR